MRTVLLTSYSRIVSSLFYHTISLVRSTRNTSILSGSYRPSVSEDVFTFSHSACWAVPQDTSALGGHSPVSAISPFLLPYCT